MVGALFFGRLSDKLGRKRLFVITLAVYLIGSGLTAFTLGNSAVWMGFLYLTRFISGMGIGGEYAAINSAIDELIPAKYRGRVDIAVNGTYWAGAIIGTLGTYIFLNQLDPGIGWRVAFLLGPVLGPGDHLRAAAPAGEPALAGHARPRGRGRGDHRLHRARGRAGRPQLPRVDDDRAIELKPTEPRLLRPGPGAVQGATRAARSSARR